MYLNCKTYFSFRYGCFSTEELVKTAAQAGVDRLALTNINNTCDTWDFVAYCLAENIQPIAGAEIRNGSEFLYILLAKDITGFYEINRLISHHMQTETPFPERPGDVSHTWVIYPAGKYAPPALKENELIGIRPSEVNLLYGSYQARDAHKYVVRQPVTFKDKTGYNLHRLLRAIDKNILLSRQTPKDIARPDETFLPQEEIIRAFSRYPAIVTNTFRIMESCSISIDFHTDKNKKTFSASKEDDRILLEKLAMDGMVQRFGSKNREARQRVIKELDIINKLGFNSYFLITWDIIRYAQSRGFFYVGRGSGANSIVAYCLQITDVNPIDLDLYFERFLNPYRTSPPDFDIDFSWKDRDEVIDYIFKRYGRDHVALLGMYSTFQHNAVIRELGKVFGLPKGEIDQLVTGTHNLQKDKIQRLILKYGSMLKNFPNHLSIHPGGMLISEEPICRYTAVELPPKGFCTAQIDMFIAENIGLYKLDILSQRGLGHIRDCIDLVRENRNTHINIHQIEKFKKDKKIAEKIRKADTIGCFYIESPAMRQLLGKLHCDNYLTLVAASSIIRPGVAQSGMMREYIYRFHHPDKFEYLHPRMKELLEETYGVMVYQEDVIKVAHHFAGLDMGEADILRRAMSGKYRGRKEFDTIKKKFFENCQEKGYPPSITAEVWRQIESFGGYSFSKAHSASFAVESYQSLYLKTYFPLEFMVAVINNFGGFYSTELYFHELKKCGAILRAPCINRSEWLTSIEGKEVFTGFIHVQNLEEKFVMQILEERKQHGVFLNLADFIARVHPPKEQLNILIRIGALGFTGKSKKELLWHANFLNKNAVEQVPAGQSLFELEPSEQSLPPLSATPLDDAFDELELLGFPLCNPFMLSEDDPSQYDFASSLPEKTGREVTILGYFVTTKPVRTIKKENMFFGTFIDAKGDWIDTVHFPDSARRYPITGRGFYLLKGKVTEEFGVYSIEVKEMYKRGIKSPLN